MTQAIGDDGYARLLAVRTRLRKFEHWSAEQAAAHGLTASQHQLLLAVRGHRDPAGPTVNDIAEYLFIRHNTAVELINRTQELGVLERVRDPDDQRAVRLRLTAQGRRLLRALAQSHVEELARLAPLVDELVEKLVAGFSDETTSSAAH